MTTSQVAVVPHVRVRSDAGRSVAVATNVIASVADGAQSGIMCRLAVTWPVAPGARFRVCEQSDRRIEPTA
jgi:hypothetical protein